MIVERLSYDPIEGVHDIDIFTQEKPKASLTKAFKANRHVYDYVFTDSKNERKFVEEQIAREERRIVEVVRETSDMVRLMTLPGVGKILAIVIALEIGAISRFRRAEQFAAYAGTTPRIHASGDKIRFGKMRSDVNRYLKWAFMEAANSVCRHKGRLPYRHVAHLYERIKNRKGHGKAIGAVARHLAEATFYMLSKDEDYKEPNFKRSGLIQRNVSAK